MAAALHQRKIIRDTIVALLSARDAVGNRPTAAGDRVQPSRLDPYRKGEVPAIGVYTLNEDVDEESGATGPRELTRRLQLKIEGWVKPGPRFDDDADALALQIETVMHADPYLGGVAGDSLLKSTDIGIHADAESPMGKVILTYTVTYRTLAPDLAIAPAVQLGLADFTTAHVTYKPPTFGPDTAPPVDIITEPS